ncbi:MAG: hypothetical protein J6A28_04135 [Clostridia bacterium]|nr:hypothetical protein [Clostridia bacterium]
MKQQNILILPKRLPGQIIETKKRIEIDCIAEWELEGLLREVAKFDYLYNKGRQVISVEYKLNGEAMFVDISEKEYKQLCNFYFKNKQEEIQAEI